MAEVVVSEERLHVQVAGADGKQAGALQRHRPVAVPPRDEAVAVAVVADDRREAGAGQEVIVEVAGAQPAGELALVDDGGAKPPDDRDGRLGHATADEWLGVMRDAHLKGLRTTATMMYGHVETVEERIEHMVRLREVQGETGGFTAFITWSYQPEHTELGGGEATGMEYLRMLALARIVLDNFPSLQASWVTQGGKVGQLSLAYGSNDMGSVMIEENVVRAAGAEYLHGRSRDRPQHRERGLRREAPQHALRHPRRSVLPHAGRAAAACPGHGARRRRYQPSRRARQLRCTECHGKEDQNHG